MQKLQKCPDTKKYDYVFVDEFQDCTQADFEIFRLLLKDPNHLCVAGDVAQAIQIGKSARILNLKMPIEKKFTDSKHRTDYLSG